MSTCFFGYVRSEEKHRKYNWLPLISSTEDIWQQQDPYFILDMYAAPTFLLR